jgi:chromosome segregation ATPase
MKKSALLIASLIVLAAGCGIKKENESLKLANEELQGELQRAQALVATLDEVGSLIDSIDRARNALNLELESGTRYEDFVARMKDINNYVQETESKIARLEQELSTNAATNQTYAKTIARLKNDLAQKTAEIEQLQAAVEQYKAENKQLLTTVDLQTAEIQDKSMEIQQKKEELALLENRIQEIMVKSQMSEADAYFARAEAAEEAARRTQLAPKRRKQSYAEAMELFKKAEALGRADAKERIAALEKKI